MGPLVSAAQLQRVESLVATAKGNGTFRAGGERARVSGMENGFFFQPTVITDVAQDARVVTDEIFGPVTVVLPFDLRGGGYRAGKRCALWSRWLGLDKQRAARACG